MNKKGVLVVLTAVMMLFAPMGTLAEANIWSPIEERNTSLFSDRVDTESVIRELKKYFHVAAEDLREKLKGQFSADESVLSLSN